MYIAVACLGIYLPKLWGQCSHPYSHHLVNTLHIVGAQWKAEWMMRELSGRSLCVTAGNQRALSALSGNCSWGRKSHCYDLNVCVPPQIHIMKPIHPCPSSFPADDGMRRWGLCRWLVQERGALTEGISTLSHQNLDHPGSLILNFQPLKLWDRDFCCL